MQVHRSGCRYTGLSLQGGHTMHCRLAPLVTSGLVIGNDGAIISRVSRVSVFTVSVFIGVKLDVRSRPNTGSRAENRELD